MVRAASFAAPLASAVLLSFAALGSLPGVAPRAALAADAPEAVAALKAAVAEVDAAMKAKDESAVSVAVKKVPPLYKAVTDGGARSAAAKELASVVKASKLTTARKDALDALVETEDGKEAWKHLQGAYPADNVEDETRWNVDVVKAVGALHPDGAIDRLVETFKKAKQADLAGAAVLALGNYKSSKQRVDILLQIVKAGKNMVPSQSTSKGVSADAQARWATLNSAIGKALDTLTGETVGDSVEWFKRVDDLKGKEKTLFRD